MPVVNRPTSIQNGPTATVLIGLTGPEVTARRRAGQPIPQPISVLALIDTGAECTCVDSTILQQLGVGHNAIGWLGAPAASTAGGYVGSVSYNVGFAIVHPSGDAKLNLVIPELTVEELSRLAQFGVEAIIGRDVRASCVVVYDGPAGSVTLAY